MLYVYLRSLELNFLHFQLDSCIVNKGEKFGHEKDSCIHLEGVHALWDAFWEVGIFPLVTGLTGVDTGLTGVEDSQNGHRSDRCGVPV